MRHDHCVVYKMFKINEMTHLDHFFLVCYNHRPILLRVVCNVRFKMLTGTRIPGSIYQLQSLVECKSIRIPPAHVFV